MLVYSGREAWDREHPMCGSEEARPGLHASCLPFIRDHDVAVLGWDMMDAAPSGYDLRWTVHAALFAYGVGLLDNASSSPWRAPAPRRAATSSCSSSPRSSSSATGSPLNPLALF